MDVLLKYTPIISAVMPLIVIILTAIWVHKRLEKIKSRLHLDHSIIQKRAEIYAEVQDDINKIYSYIKCNGKWKEFTPTDVLKAKRDSDQKFHTTQPYWSSNMFSKYHAFINVCFMTNRGPGTDAGIIALVNEYKVLDSWDDKYIDYFVGGFDSDTLETAYSEFMASLSIDFGIV